MKHLRGLIMSMKCTLLSSLLFLAATQVNATPNAFDLFQKFRQTLAAPDTLSRIQDMQIKATVIYDQSKEAIATLYWHSPNKLRIDMHHAQGPPQMFSQEDSKQQTWTDGSQAGLTSEPWINTLNMLGQCFELITDPNAAKPDQFVYRGFTEKNALHTILYKNSLGLFLSDKTGQCHAIQHTSQDSKTTYLLLPSQVKSFGPLHNVPSRLTLYQDKKPLLSVAIQRVEFASLSNADTVFSNLKERPVLKQRKSVR
jgi:hypothetical protein